METSAVLMKIDRERVGQSLQELGEKLDGAQGEVVLDFSSVQRIDSDALRALERLADAVDSKGTKLILSHVNVDIYKVLKLMKLAQRFDFA